jgi:geranylgeranyl diphosphate synthase type I
LASPSLDAKVREHGRLVNEAMARYLPTTRGVLARSMEEYVALASRRIRPSFAVYEPMRHVVAAGGKRIRPTLCLLACEAAGGRAADAVPTAVGIEFLHTFTLVHDDIMDKALTRRGHATVGALWGDEVAITVGDGLFALAFQAFTDNARVEGMPPERVFEVLRRASKVSLDLAQGQTLDLLYAKRDDVTVGEYMEMIRLKTGILLEFSLASGAILGGADAARVEALSRFGEPLGLAFQIRDDLLDLVGDPKRLGKPLGGDIRTGKRTLMVAHAFERSPEAKRLAQILDAPPDATSDDDVREAVGILERAGSLAFGKQRAEAALAEAKRALADLSGASMDLAALGGLADYILHREE